MPFRFIDLEGIADIAFEATAPTLEGLLAEAVRATTSVMIRDPGDLAEVERRCLRVEADSEDLLLHEVLQEVLYRKDAEGILFRTFDARIEREGGRLRVVADAAGDRIDAQRHELLTDVKAATLHELRVERTADGWRARVLLDI